PSPLRPLPPHRHLHSFPTRRSSDLIADTGNQVLLFVGMRLSERPPDRAHGFGHGKDVYFWAFVVSLLFFSLGGAFSIWEGLHKLDRKSTRLNSSHVSISYAVFCLKK